MLPDAADTNTASEKTSYTRNKRLALLLIIAASLLTLSALLWVSARGAGPKLKIPADIAGKITSPIYVPAQLPGNYKVDEQSFTMAENDTVLIFEAMDGVSGNLIFSEQPRPKDFDYDGFYKSQFADVKTLNNVPFPSVWGKAPGKRVVLSVVAENTWIMMSTTAPLGAEDMLLIAKGLKKY